MRTLSRRLVALGALMFLGGCHSAFVEATLRNTGSAPVRLVEVDYPSASFGTEVLNPGQEYHYRFKILGTGPVSATWTDTARAEHKSNGPELREGMEGTLTATFGPDGVTWAPHWLPASTR